MTGLVHAPPLDVDSPLVSEPLPRGLGRLVVGLVRAARPKQWIKNVLVFAAPGAAGVLTVPEKLADALIAFAVLCAAASGTYFLNDARDAACDRAHPVKRHRPIAAGTVPLPLAYILAAVLGAGAVGAAVIMLNGATALLVALYLAVTTSYSCRLKRVPMLDIVIVSSGFVARAVAGALATGVPVSRWFLTVTGCAAIFMVAGKRSAELKALPGNAASHRTTLTTYTEPFLQNLQTLAATVAITAYSLWAFGLATTPGQTDGAAMHGSLWFQLSIGPFVLGLLRYSLRAAQGHGGAPEELVLHDRVLLLTALMWTSLFAVGVYVG